jgi:8-oxo-dGTP pyrophosphatase MutT (NUDIX family)
VAAVSVILRPTPFLTVESGSTRPTELLLIRRAEHARDPWSGHMALPGGRREPGDLSLLDTARREAMEEVGIALDGATHVIGRLDPVAPRNAHLPRLTILPLVFVVPGETVGRVASPREVAALHWVPLDQLRDPARHTSISYPPAGDLRFPAFDVAGGSVWGLTHRVLSDLLGRWE